MRRRPGSMFFRNVLKVDNSPFPVVLFKIAEKVNSSL